MAVVIRLKRAGAKGRPFYRVVVADSRYPRDGRFIEQLGYYDPLTKPSTFQVDAEKLAKWIRNGAQPSESVAVMVAKIAPEALRPVRLAPAAAPAPDAEAPEAKKPAKKKAAAKKKAPARKKAATKGSEKKAKARAKAKAKKGGAAKAKAPKKAKK